MNSSTYDNETINKPFELEELKSATKKLKKEKSPGPDEIYNELIIFAGKSLQENILKMINRFWMDEKIPDELYKISIKSLYKGKGATADLNNQRGLFLGSNVIKLYERMIESRAKPVIEKGMSKYQAGGRQGYGINEQIFILRAILEYYDYMNIKIYLEFIDLKKAFDKMILRNVMNDLWKINIRGKIWRNIYEINCKAIIKIKTAIGETEEVEVGEVLKQGSVLASSLAAMHTDTISRYTTGIKYGDIEIPQLLFQDDIVKLDKNKENLQKSNLILENYQKYNRMAFHPEKTQILAKTNPEVYLNGNLVKNVEKYKYLGDVISLKGKCSEMIDERRNTCAGTVAELVSISYEIKQYDLIAAAQYLNGIIAPKLLLNAETWNTLSSKDYDELEKIQSQSLKRLLHIPYTTPTRGLYCELGIMSIKSQIKIKRLTFMWKLINKESNTLAHQVFKEQQKLPGPTWTKKTLEIAEEIGINNIEEIKEYSKDQWKNIVKRKIWKKEQEEFITWAESSKKCNHMKNEQIKMKNYIKDMNTNQARTVLCIRVGMLETKENFHAMFEDVTCRNCKKEKETSEHLIKCLANEQEKEILKNFEQIWSLKNLNILKRVASTVYSILKYNTIFEYSG